MEAITYFHHSLSKNSIKTDRMSFLEDEDQGALEEFFKEELKRTEESHQKLQELYIDT
jgi:hypothetical protein